MIATGMGKHVAHEVDAAALPGSMQHPLHGGLQPFMRVGDDQLDAAQASARETAQELGPEGFGFAGADGHSEHFAAAVGVDRGGDRGRDRDNAPVLADLHVGCIKPEIWPLAFDWPVQESIHPLIDLGTKPLDLALADTGRPHGLHQVIDGAGRNAMDVGLLDHRRQCFFGSTPGFEERREVAAFPQPGNA